MAIIKTVAETQRFFSFQNGEFKLPSSCVLNLSNSSLRWKILQFSDFHDCCHMVSCIVKNWIFNSRHGSEEHKCVTVRNFIKRYIHVKLWRKYWKFSIFKMAVTIYL